MNSFSKITAIFVAAILMFLLPLYSVAQKADRITQTYVSDKTAEFVNAVRNSGKLTEDMYDQFVSALSDTGNVYEINIVHQHGVYYPIYDENDIATGDVSLQFYNTYEEDIVKELYENNGVYRFSENDYISVVVKSINKTMADTFQSILLDRSTQEGTIYVSYGGKIRDES